MFSLETPSYLMVCRKVGSSRSWVSPWPRQPCPPTPTFTMEFPARLEQCLAETSPPSSQMMTLPEVSTATRLDRPRFTSSDRGSDWQLHLKLARVSSPCRKTDGEQHLESSLPSSASWMLTVFAPRCLHSAIVVSQVILIHFSVGLHQWGPRLLCSSSMPSPVLSPLLPGDDFARGLRVVGQAEVHQLNQIATSKAVCIIRYED